MNRLLLVFFCGLVCLGSLDCKRNENALNVYIWTQYLPQSVLDDFKTKTGITVNVSNYATNEELQEKLQAGVVGYDIVVPSDYMVHRLVTKNLLKTIDRSKLQGLDNLDSKLLNQSFDPYNDHSIPYFWGTTGIGYNKAKLGTIDSWAAAFDAKNKGRILMLNDGREQFAAALHHLGSPVNTSDPQVLAKAAAVLKEQKPLVRLYDSDTFAEKLASGDVDLAQGYGGQFAKVIAEKPDALAYVVPKEGGTLWMDNLCIPASAPHEAAAYAFLNYILQPEVAAKIATAAAYASPNIAARKLLDPAMRDNPIIYAPDDVIGRCQVIQDNSEAGKLINQYMIEIKAQ